MLTQAPVRPDGVKVSKAVDERWITVNVPTTPRSLRTEGLESADRELIEQKRVPILTNDRAVATVAKLYGVSVKWLTQALIDAVNGNLLKPAEARTLLRDLVRARLRVRSEVMAEMINLIEESRGR